jgi:hypothetical protein
MDWVTRSVRVLAIGATVLAGAGCGGKASQSDDAGGGRGGAGRGGGGGGVAGAQAGGAGGQTPTDAGPDGPSPSDGGGATGSDARDAADAPADTASTSDARDAADAPSGTDAPADTLGPPVDGGNLPGVWYELGGSATGLGLTPTTPADSEGSFPAIAIDVSGHPLVAWLSARLSFGVSLKHWNGSAWGGLGQSDRNDGVAWEIGAAGGPGLATTGGGVPIAAWATNRGVMARRWQARVWDSIGSSTTFPAGLSNGVVGDLVSIAVDAAGRPVVAWRVRPETSTATTRIMLRAWDGTSWVERGGSGSGLGLSGMTGVRWPSVAIDAQGQIVVAWDEWSSTSPSNFSVKVKRWNGTAWQAIDPPLATGNAVSPRVAVDSTGRPIVAWTQSTPTTAPTSRIYVQRWNGTVWEELGGSASGGGLGGAGFAATPALAVDEKDRIAVAWKSRNPAAGAEEDIFLRMWDGQGWTELGGSGSGSGISNTPTVYSWEPAVAARGNRVCVSWNESTGWIQMRCFDLATKFCSCDTTVGCEAGCACDVGCVTPAWDDFACPAGAYRCHDGRCVTGVVPCNGVSDCADGSDESPLCPNGALVDSPRGTGCNYWVCADGTCANDVRCNRRVECPDGSDEDAVCDVASAFARESIDFPALSLSGIEVTGMWTGPSGTWAIGSGGNVLRRDPGGWVHHTGGFGTLGSIWGSGNSLLLVPIAGSLLDWDGSAWSLLNFSTSSSQGLTGVWGTGPNDIWVVGYASGGTRPAVAWHGSSPTTWSAINPQLAAPLQAVAGSATDDVWAVGDGGAILHWNGSAFSATTSGTTVRLRGVWASARDSAWAVGEQGTILRWTGGPSWTPIAPITQAHLWGVWGASAGDVWAVGNGGAVLHWNGTKWTNVWSGTSKDLYAVTGSGSDVWVGGPPGAILHLTR